MPGCICHLTKSSDLRQGLTQNQLETQRAKSERQQYKSQNSAYNFLFNYITSVSTNKVVRLKLVAYSSQVLQQLSEFIMV